MPRFAVAPSALTDEGWMSSFILPLNFYCENRGMHGKHRTSPPGAELRFGSGECVAPPQPNARYELPSPPWAELRRTYSAFAVEYLTGRAETKSI